MMKRIISALLLCLLMITMLPVGVLATETTEAEVVREPGQCGDDLTWSYDNGCLTISGSGDMDNYPDGDAPWLEYKDSITHLVISGNVTSIGESAFEDYDSLESVNFGSAMHTIHRRAFKGCDGITDFDLPATFRRFGEESFMGCSNLMEIRCKGPMPSFNGNCLWDTHATIFYPTNNPWPPEEVQRLYNAFQCRISFFMGEGTMAVSVTETVPPTTEPPVTEAPTVPETTVAPAVPETTEAPTEVPTEAPTEPTVETVKEPDWIHEIQESQPEEEEQPQKRSMSGIWFGLFLITGVLSLILIGALVFRRRRY